MIQRATFGITGHRFTLLPDAPDLANVEAGNREE
jgi:hypothetical protein